MPRKIKFIHQSVVARIFFVVLVIGWHNEVLAEAATRQALVTSALRVCADPNSLPYSNKSQEGFENKIADLIAEELGVPVKYTWWPQTIGFIRNTLRLRKCDLIIGMTTTHELVQNTNPYYRTIYTMVFREDSGISATHLNDRQLVDKRMGVVAGTPPATILALNGSIGKAKAYPLLVDTRRYSVSQMMIDDLISGTIDVALMFGPTAGYYSTISEEKLVVVPLMNEDPAIRLDFRISMALRYSETEWKRSLNDIIRKIQPQIYAILHDLNVPLLDDKGDLIPNPG